MKRSSSRIGLPAVGCLLVLSCGSGSDSGVGTSSGIPGSTTIGSLTAAQAATLCDWQNAKQGGYGHVSNCSDGSTQETDPDHATCVSDVPVIGAACPTLTVGDIEDCADALGTDICNLPTEPACAAFNTCVGG